MEGEADHPVMLLPPPPVARVELACEGEDVTLRLKPLGMMVTNPDLFWQAPAVFGLWLVVAIALLNGGPGATAFFFIVLLPLLAVPATWFLLSVHRAIQQGVIDIVDNRLVVSRYGVFGLEQDEWSIQRVQSIRVVPVPGTGASLVGRPAMMELQLTTRRGAQHEFFAGRDPLELQWLADTMEQVMGIAQARQAA
ncbi:MAG: hypothetical protein WD534_02010 [Phycisphaeraceae bacterium]